MLKINEVFGPTIQGEGPSIGKKVVFLRLSLCNLHCVWCDTPYTWNWIGTKFAHPQKFDKNIELHTLSNDVLLQRMLACGLGEVKALVVSGGEPLLQQEELVSLLQQVKALGCWIEIETNGTLAPNSELLEVVDQINCSPKLLNSGNEPKLMTRPNALEALSSCSKTIFKFVVAQHNDIFEIERMVDRYRFQQVYLMPEGRTQTELNLHASIVQQLCNAKGYIFADRLHIRLFGAKRGV